MHHASVDFLVIVKSDLQTYQCWLHLYLLQSQKQGIYTATMAIACVDHHGYITAYLTSNHMINMHAAHTTGALQHNLKTSL